jgi:uncharacterized coiled-coil DUF342 family protein
MDVEKEAKEATKSPSSFDKQVTDLYAERDRLSQRLVDESSQTVSWKTHAKEVHTKITLLEKELQSCDAVNKLVSADIESLGQVAKVSVGKEVVALKKSFGR